MIDDGQDGYNTPHVVAVKPNKNEVPHAADVPFEVLNGFTQRINPKKRRGSGNGFQLVQYVFLQSGVKGTQLRDGVISQPQRVAHAEPPRRIEPRRGEPVPGWKSPLRV